MQWSNTAPDREFVGSRQNSSLRPATVISAPESVTINVMSAVNPSKIFAKAVVTLLPLGVGRYKPTVGFADGWAPGAIQRLRHRHE